MNELIESEPELYGADVEDAPSGRKKAKEDLSKNDIYIQLNNNDINLGVGILSADPAADDIVFNDIFDVDEISLEDPEEERENLKTRKE
jgi:hypothetical protein